ncbi:hypothetical protein GCM10010124_36780 [Pilimelia terevasa]|uniref:Uncharacterized protein n=1 Tax=Pilimelia terevasa TaxID=53372 RepID=A0A8J3FJJ5_9ACTN|nr:hypothetical protein GCM10010124_36780 [Pilimelia terevasa]
MMRVSDLRWSETSNVVRWKEGSRIVKISLDQPPTSVVLAPATNVVVVVDSSPNGSKLSNAVLFDCNGCEIRRLKPPNIWSEPSWRLGFYFVMLEPDDSIRAVFSTTVGDVSGIVDLNTGELIDVAEWR